MLERHSSRDKISVFVLASGPSGPKYPISRSRQISSQAAVRRPPPPPDSVPRRRGFPLPVNDDDVRLPVRRETARCHVDGTRGRSAHSTHGEVHRSRAVYNYRRRVKRAREKNTARHKKTNARNVRAAPKLRPESTVGPGVELYNDL